jgi:hypothetical protein
MRPTFTVELPVGADEAIEQICQSLQANSSGGRSIFSGRNAELFVADQDRRIWSPRLSIQVEDSQGGCILHGRFAPRPEIWTFLMFLYFLTVTIVFFGVMLGCAQLMIGEAVWGLWAAAAGVLIIVGLHAASLIGQRLGNDQMEQLRKRLDDVVQASFHTNRGPDRPDAAGLPGSRPDV